MVAAITPFLMFQGEAEAAMTFYASVVPGVEVGEITRHGPGPVEGKVLQAVLTVAGRPVRVFDSPVPHAFGFTPAFSFFVDCDDEAELDRLVAGLGEGGEHLMPPANYGFSRKFCWLNDRFGVSWQLNLP